MNMRPQETHCSSSSFDFDTSSGQYQAYNVWNAPTRSFHWINALAVLGLIIVGVLLLNDDALGQVALASPTLMWSPCNPGLPTMGQGVRAATRSGASPKRSEVTHGRSRMFRRGQ
jgi:hypothetical protein